MKSQEIRRVGLEMLLHEGSAIDIGEGINVSYNVPVYGKKKWFGVIEILATSDSQNVGFAFLSDNQNAHYLIRNVLWGYKRPNLQYKAYHGIEVHPSFRRRGIGKAMLSLGIAIAQLRTPPHLKSEFRVSACDMEHVIELYRNMNFSIHENTVIEGITIQVARYTKSEIVPEFEIKPEL